MPAWPATAGAATLTVDTARDELAPHDGRCSLREAVAAVNTPGRRTDCGTASRRQNTIVLGARRYGLSIAPRGRNDNTSGDLDLTGSGRATVLGRGAGLTVIDAAGLGDRVLSVAPGAELTLSRLSITGGRAPNGAPGTPGQNSLSCGAGGAGGPGQDGGDAGDGGGIFNAGRLRLSMVRVIGNRAGAGGAGGMGGSPGAASACRGGRGGSGGSGGGVYNRGRLSVADSTIANNVAGPGGSGGAGGGSLSGAGGPGGRGGFAGSGGGIYSRGRLSVSTSTIYDNRAGRGGPGGQSGPGVTASEADGTGGSGGSGGGIFSTYGRLSVVNSTLVANGAGAGGRGGGGAGAAGAGGSGGAVATVAGPGALRDDTLAGNGTGPGGTGSGGGGSGTGGALYAQPRGPGGDMRLQNTIVASSVGPGCAGSGASAIANAGHNLSYGDRTCPGRPGNPRLGSLEDNGGATRTMALGAGSAALNRVPRADCPGRDQRGVRRPQGRECDIGAYEFATPKVILIAPSHHASYERGSRILARFRCLEGGIASTIASCRGTVPRGHRLSTGRLGKHRFRVTAIDRTGHRLIRTIHYSVWEYVNPVRRVSGLAPRRIDLGVDYGGSGPLLALGEGKVTMASDTDSGPESCWAISCWPGGGIVVYRLTAGPFAGKYVYMAEHITVSVRAGQMVRAGQRIATLYAGYPWVEIGWAAGPGAEALGMADGHRCTCSDPGGWSTIEGRTFDHLLVLLGAPSAYLQPDVPQQSMPSGWPSWSG